MQHPEIDRVDQKLDDRHLSVLTEEADRDDDVDEAGGSSGAAVGTMSQQQGAREAAVDVEAFGHGSRATVAAGGAAKAASAGPTQVGRGWSE